MSLPITNIQYQREAKKRQRGNSTLPTPGGAKKLFQNCRIVAQWAPSSQVKINKDFARQLSETTARKNYNTRFLRK
ncbi:MAG: hypothetical protein KAJ01_09850, partial [Candidatus Hydrogenedentes bacterium]|nr:hypothetical protein [Candidatus Hydrogenedentota bacterium]